MELRVLVNVGWIGVFILKMSGVRVGYTTGSTALKESSVKDQQFTSLAFCQLGELFSKGGKLLILDFQAKLPCKCVQTLVSIHPTSTLSFLLQLWTLIFQTKSIYALCQICKQFYGFYTTEIQYIFKITEILNCFISHINSI